MVSPVYIKPLLALLVMAAIIGIVAVVFRTGSFESAPVSSVNRRLPLNIDVALRNARFSEIQGGLIAWVIIAGQADYDKKGDTVFLSDIRMEFPGNRTYGAVTVTADKGEYTSSAKNVRLNGHVHAVTENGASFDTASIVYTGATDQFSTAVPVRFRQQRLQLDAVGMDFGVKNQVAHFYSAVEASIVPD